MIVQRQRFIVKPGRVNEAVEMMQEMWKLVDAIPHRIYRSISGRHNTIIDELEFEDFAQYQEWWADTGPKIAPLMEKWHALVDTGGSTEFLRLVE